MSNIQKSRLPESDQTILTAVQIYETKTEEGYRCMGGDEEQSALLDAGENAAKVLPHIRAVTMAGIRAKARWLSRAENYNDGGLEEGTLNGDVLLSLLRDIEELPS